jgi:catechol 2,3-dioxygenase-like lactoylglutathione lyase family enzyme
MDAAAQPELKSAVNVQQAVPFFMISDMDASLKFYVEGLGFTLERKWIVEGKIRWCWLRIGDAALMLQERRRENGAPAKWTEKPGAGVEICFQCQDALAIYREITTRGIKARNPFVGNNMWVTFVHDPDGYKVSFESLTDAPEESEYSPAAG